MSNPLTPRGKLPGDFGNPITEDDIADYLLNTPDFFERHAQLLAEVQLSSPHGQRTVSLQERQAVLLREKIKLLESRIMDMVRNVNDNMALSDKLLTWSRQLFLVTEPADLPDQLAEELARLFSVPQVAIKVWGVSPRYADCSFAQGASDDARVFVASLPEPFCGVNTGLELVNCLPDPGAAASLAVLPLRQGGPDAVGSAFGMMILASPDAQRFNSTMGTEFLSRMSEMAAAALNRLR